MPVDITELNQILNEYESQFACLDVLAPVTLEGLMAKVNDEANHWGQHSAGLQEIASVFQDVRKELSVIGGERDGNGVRDRLSRAFQAINRNKNAVVLSSSPLGQFLVDLQSRDAEAARAAAWYLIRHGSTPSFSQSNMKGIIAAIAFEQPEFYSSSLAASLKAFEDKQSIIDTASSDITVTLRELRRQSEEWRDAAESSVQQVIAAGKENLERCSGTWENTFKQSHEALKRETEAIKKQMADLKSVYEEKLRLAEPAAYWESLEKTYKSQGRVWISLSTAAVGAFVAVIGTIAYKPPAILTEPVSAFGGVKGALLLGAGVSMIIYLINLFVRMSTSSYHLARDARERYQLTYVFLALLREHAMEGKDREIILSALFSRSDTGLLKYDSSPTIPTPLGSLIENLKK
jgi:hypothetical protein